MEFVFVVPREKLFPEFYPHGFTPFCEEGLEQTMEARIEEFGFFVERERAERTPEWKQVIPYTAVIRKVPGTETQVFCLRRTKRGGESRLHDKLSIGVGGHINPVDAPQTGAKPKATAGETSQQTRNPIANATTREVLEEELIVRGSHSLRSIGLLNDDSNPVGAVHVGWVQAMYVAGDVEVREVDQLEGTFRSAHELQSMLESGANFETWSSLLLPHLLSDSSLMETGETDPSTAGTGGAAPGSESHGACKGDEKITTQGASPIRS